MTDTHTQNLYADVSQALKAGRATLIDNLLAGKAPTFLDDHARLIDDYFRQSYEKSVVGPKMDIAKNPYAVVALGGYGRGEQCVYSDVDLLFLFEKRVPRVAEDLVREIIYPLWDMGLDVGHATRSIKECMAMARKDFEVLTSILDARFICGMSPLFMKLMDQIRSKFINLKPDSIISWLVDTNRDRHRRFGDSSYLLEPNFKEGQGGLRDYHTMLWIAKIKSGIKQRRDLEYYGYFSHDDYARLNEALNFIWDVRNRFHLMMNRKSDQIHLEQQRKLAEAMGIPPVNGHLPVEYLLGELHRHMEYVKQQHEMFLYEMEQQKRLKRKNKGLKTTEIKGLKFNRGMLNFTSPEKILNNPRLLIDIFVESAAQKAPLNSEAKRLVADFSYLVDDRFRSDPDVVKQFERILIRSSRAFEVLNQMLNTGFLVRFIPEFKDVVNRIQFDQYHLYPVARHLLYTIRILRNFDADALAPADPLVTDLYKELKKKKLLLWAALLHDIGKGEPIAGHSERGAAMAEKILLQKGFNPADAKTVAFLVEHHLLLAQNATRRDINDEETAISLARTIKKIETLKMLYLLTVADSMATGPKAWNDWTSSLLRNLFLKVFNILKNGELASGRAVRIVEKKRQAVAQSMTETIAAEQLDALLNFMSPRYMLYTPVENIPRHLALHTELGERPFVWHIDKSADADTRTVTICAKDRPGLISRIAGVFTLNGIDILDVQVFTWRNNIALDVFEVNPPPDPIFEDERWERARCNLEDALAGQLELSKELLRKKNDTAPIQPYTAERPTEIVVDNETSSFFTIIEVVTFDFPGLLFRVTDALFKSGLDIWVAKIATKVDQVVDVFYVRDFDGQKVDAPQQVESVKAAIKEILPGEDPQHG
ncbi:[protein-PII] uridylyltransferase [Desulfosarcina ovata]|uniref:Bifunctional uridylyltransferase/uridylyl-removing enzyme n=1 Tax=Desulfosarcina ovata subsp. ovata TaxID=2752305 RepID=A0A5K8AE63_9BACT|nr:[protein-PII] uridylyltransferase [Desulfosarcina ovata]BBO90851.1 bifunctional uridylyltransferase/uridylyl-removing enzyme [Desulfosarcina ovata subsp. ovata]